MSLQFILGSGTSDFEEELTHQSSDWLNQDKNNRVFYLVPNHIKFETEISVLKQLKEMRTKDSHFFSSIHLQVFSFTRLAWYFLQNDSTYSPETLSEPAVMMILKKILSDCKSDLTVFRGESQYPGFIKTLGELFNEFFQANIGSFEIHAIIDKLGTTPQEIDLKNKLSDLDFLYSQYEQYLSSHKLQSIQLLNQLVDYLETMDLSNIMFVVSGFTHFTSNESLLLDCLLRKSGEIRLALVLDKGYSDSLPPSNNLFYSSAKTYFYYYNLSRKNSLPVLRDKIVRNYNKSITKSIYQLDELWKNMYSDEKNILEVENNSDIHITAAENSTAEIISIAKKIHYLVFSSSIRYKDIRILTRDMSNYKMIILPIFGQNNIPIAFQDDIKMSHHPLVAFLQSLFLIKKNFFRYKDIFRFLRTRLFLPCISGEESLDEYARFEEEYQEKVDITENIVIAQGYEGECWKKNEDWSYIQYSSTEEYNDKVKENQIISNEIRNNIKKSLIPFFSSLDTCKNGKEAAVYLYQFLIEQKIDKILIYWRNTEIGQGLLDEARVHEQAWQELINLLDDYVMVFGENTFDLDEFITVFSTGLENTTYSKVPATIDQVSVSSIDTIHGEKKKITFIIGLTDNVLPMKMTNSTLLSDNERAMLETLLPDEQHLQQTIKQAINQEPFTAYMAFMSSMDQLYLSYPRINSNNEKNRQSPYITNIAKVFNLEINMKSTYPSLMTNSIQEISTFRQLFSDIVIMLKEAEESHVALSPFWNYLLTVANNAEESNTMLRHILKSLSAQNTPQALSQNAIQSLYGDTIYTSVSQIENFYKCEYRYLLKYGLKLYEREKFELNPLITGDFFHEALDKILNFIIINNINLNSLSEIDWESTVNSILIDIFEESRFGIFSVSSRMKYIRYLLTNTVKKVSWALKQQSGRTNMRTLKTELVFGYSDSQNGGLDGLEFMVGKNQTVKVRGKIDRLDGIFLHNQSPYVSIVDYKSSSHKFDYRDIYYGLAMQMMTYLDVALNNSYSIFGKKAEPVGAFYLYILDPILKPKDIKYSIETVLLKKYQYNGILIQDEELLDKLDVTLEDKESSLIYPLKRLANGKYSSSQFVTTADIDNLRKHVHHKYHEAGVKIFKGSTQLNPAYQDKTRIACQNCEFKSICQFDVLLQENNYSRIDKIKKEDVLKILNNETTGGNSCE